ncbi:MAG: diadenylate cyclase CdaA, partial [Alistipes sp.]|nr:diadenylate cyclase CdaA [Alistipes sp.]
MDFIPFTLIDLIDIVLVATIMYWIYRVTRGTNAPYIFSGIIAIYLLWVVVRALNMELLSSMLGQVISVGVIALIILFQPELRRFLQLIGLRQKHFNFISRIFSTTEEEQSTVNIEPIVTACRDMAETKTGALIVIRQESDLRLIAEGGIAIDAKTSVSLLKNIFFKNAPLHDGAVLVEGDRIVAAKCILPVTQSDVPKDYGTRHRAAIGMSEISDAIIVIVSEETGG